MHYFQYATLENGKLTRHTFFNKSIDTNIIEKVERRSSDLVIFSGNKRLTLNLNFMEAESINTLNEILFDTKVKTAE